MCNPAAASIGMNILGGASSYESAKENAAAQQKYYNYLAGANETQAQEVLATADQQVTMIQDAAGQAAKTLKNQGKGLEGRQKVALAASGVGAGSVTSEDIAKDTLSKEELDQAAIRYNADSRAWEAMTGAQASARGLRSQATQYRYAGANAIAAGDIAAKTSLLGTATNVADNWYKWSTTSTGASKKKVAGQYVTSADSWDLG